jgi:dTDP-4-amino-4,6-dideoxygalactose transaminase
MILCANPSAQFAPYQAEIEDAVLSVIRGKSFILGKEVEALEKDFSSYIGTSNSVGVANGTDAIELALRALDIGSGDEVITVSHTAVATVAAIEASGAQAVLVDVDALTYTLNPLQLSEAYSQKTKAVIVVHLYGHSADLDAILEFCNVHKLFLIEDVSQAHGAKYKGARLGSIGHIGCFSCYPTKNLGAIGDAGLITTNNPNLAKKLCMLREYGWNNRLSEYAGRNSRLDELQAAILRIKLKHLDRDNKKRLDIAKFYLQELANIPLQLPKINLNVDHVFHLFVVQSDVRSLIIEYLKKNSIQAGIHYPVPIHLQPYYKDNIKTVSDMQITENVANNILSLPIYPQLENHKTEKIVRTIKKFFELS